MPGPGDFSSLRMLVVGGRPHTVQLLRQILDMLGVRRVLAAGEMPEAIEMLRTQRFAAVFCDEHVGDKASDAFVLAARRTPGLINPMVPIFLVSGGPKRRDVESARDLGFTDVLARPLSAATVMRKVRTALGHPRPFIAAEDFFGPDRRSPARVWTGRDRRKRQPRRLRVGAVPASGEQPTD